MSVVLPIEEDSRYRIIAAAAGQTVLAIPFPWQDDNDISLFKRVDDAWIALANPAGYTLTGAGAAGGGSATLMSPAADGDQYLALGDAVLDRLSSIVRDGRFKSKSTDDEFDRNRIIQQEQARDLSRAVKVGFGQTSQEMPTPDGISLLGWSQDNKLVNRPSEGASVAAAEAAADRAEAAAAAVPAEAAVRVIEFDIRMSQFAGGAKLNGIDDDRPALQAAVNYAKTLGTEYYGKSARIRLPRGQIRIDSVTSPGVAIDVTDAHGVNFTGDGRGSTQIQSSVNAAVFKASNLASVRALAFTEFNDFTILGPGSSNLLAHGIDLGAPFNCRVNVRIWACRDAFRSANSWQTTLADVRFDGTGGFANYNGINQVDGELSIAENSIFVFGGVIQGVVNAGWRGECVSGTKANGLEIVGCGNYGLYLGDSPGGKDLKWFSWVGGLVDTCGQMVVVKKGGASLAERIHLSGMWVSYATTTVAGSNIGVLYEGLTDCTFQADVLGAVNYGILARNCSRINMSADTVREYDRLVTGAPGVLIENTTDSTFELGSMNAQAGSPAANAIVETGTSARNTILRASADRLIYTIPGNGSRTVGCRMVASGTSVNCPDHNAEFAKANLPAASSFWKSRIVMVTDEVGGYTPAFCDGTNWRRVADRAIVS